nr:alpha/beta hydrolase [Bacilli bacterium]
MNENSFIFEFLDHTRTTLYSWFPEDNAKGILLIVHGMVEHALRYQSFAKALTAQGWIVFAFDLRGHGPYAAKTGTLGDSGVDGFTSMANDIDEVSDYINHQYPSLPCYLFGHSMGSFLVQHHLIHASHPSYQGVILSGSGAPIDTLTFAFGSWMAKREIKKIGETSKSDRLHQLFFRSYNRRITQPTTEYDWLSSNPASVKAYRDDPYCGFTCSARFYRDFLMGLRTLAQHQPLTNLAKNTPILLLSGKEDPVGKYGKGITSLFHRIQQAGFQKVSITLYEQARHELLHEMIVDQVTLDVINWLGQTSTAP